jgi:hypothetical protein
LWRLAPTFFWNQRSCSWALLSLANEISAPLVLSLNAALGNRRLLDCPCKPWDSTVLGRHTTAWIVYRKRRSVQRVRRYEIVPVPDKRGLVHRSNEVFHSCMHMLVTMTTPLHSPTIVYLCRSSIRMFWDGILRLITSNFWVKEIGNPLDVHWIIENTWSCSLFWDGILLTQDCFRKTLTIAVHQMALAMVLITVLGRHTTDSGSHSPPSSMWGSWRNSCGSCTRLTYINMFDDPPAANSLKICSGTAYYCFVILFWALYYDWMCNMISLSVSLTSDLLCWDLPIILLSGVTSTKSM